MVVTKSEYLARVQSELSRYRYFEKEPTPQLLAEVQRKCSALSIPIPRDDKGSILPYPTTKSKKEIFNRDKYSEIDNHALKAPTELHAAELSELVNYLLKPAKTDVAKVRVIFRWISGQDLLRYKHIHAPPKESAAMYLNDLKQNKGSYESLFRQMCKYAGIPCEKITGYAKGVSYNVGEDIGDTARNTWNAVLVDKTWRLIDMQWASRQVVTQDKGEWELIDDGTGSKPAKSEDSDVSYDIYAYEEFYFLTDPEEFVYSHFPDEEAWQLLARPMTFEEFQKIAYLRSKFFELSMTVMSHPWCVLQAVNGEANLDMGFNSDTMKFSYNLYRSTKVEHKQIQGNVDMDKFLFLETIPDEKTLSVEIFFPTTGKFKAEIFGRDTNESDTVLKWLCTYVFYCETPKTNCRPLPQNPRKEWGPGSDTINMGMEAITHKRGKINVDDGEVEVKFSLNKDRDFLHKLTTEDNKTLDNYTVHRIENGEVIFHARVPGKGQYMLSIMAKEDDEEGGYPSVCNYLLRCDEEFPPLEPFPEIPNGELGPTDEFKKLGLALVENCSAMVTVDKTGQLFFKMKIPNNVEFFAKLGLLIDGNVEDKSEYVSWYREGEIVTFELRFGQKGSYRFNLFAKPAGQPGGFPRAFSSIIEVPIPMMVAMSFPEKYAGWTDECKLIEPFNKNLPSKDKVDFAAVVPNAKAVAVVGNEWTQLKKDKDGIWKNQVATIEEGKPMFLSAKFDEAGNSFSHLLKYDVISKEKMDEIARDQKKAHNDADAEYHERTKMKETLKKKAEEKRKQEALEKRRRMELQIMEDGEKKQIEERLDYEEAGKTLSSSDSTARRLEEERKKREEDRKKKDEKIRKREADNIQKRDSRSSATPEDSYFVRPSTTRGSKSADALRDQLMLAIKQKNKVNLERAIAECEAAKLPEIEADLYQAKSCLNSLDSGRSASASPETLRDQLKRAIIQKDKTNLEKAIEEYEASGVHSADDDLHKAKCLLETLGGGRAGIKTPDSLRKDLETALKKKDVNFLEQAINECKSSGFAELDSHIDAAQETLENLKNNLRGNTLKNLQSQIRTAIKHKNKPRLERLVDECESSGYEELQPDIFIAKEILEELGNTREGAKSPDLFHDRLKSSLKYQNKPRMENVISEMEGAKYPELFNQLHEARAFLDALSEGDKGLSVEYLREALKKAMRKKDKESLEETIEKCVEFNYPELESEIHHARDILELMRTGRAGSKSPFALREQLNKAIDQNDIAALQKTIEECEETGYAELGYDLSRARDKLHSLGCGKGGTQIPDSFREKLKSAMKLNEKQKLEKVINECVAAGFSELQTDIHEARDMFYVLGGGVGGIETPQKLRERLNSAIEKKNVENLKSAIAECEQIGYPELGAELSKARDTLESLGGGRGGIKSPDELRKKLMAARNNDDKSELERIILECAAAGMHELDADIQEARDSLYMSGAALQGQNYVEALRDRLQTAIRDQDKRGLETLIYESENACLPELSFEVHKAREMLEKLGGGSGGYLSLDILLKKLKTARERKDIDDLRNVINECVAAGMPKLSPDIIEARNSLDILCGGTGKKKPSEILHDELTKAISSKNIGNLNKAIDECEAAGYLELSHDLKKARATLETLGGGYGGSKTSDIYRNKIRTAIKEKDKSELEKTINSSIALGMSELDSEILQAKKALKHLKQDFKERKPVEILRSELQDATRSKDKSNLAKLIDECEIAEYPELSIDLCKARDVLESLGGGRGGSKTSATLREKIKTAEKRKDIVGLEKCINECLSAGMSDLDSDISRARDSLHVLRGGSGTAKSTQDLQGKLSKAILSKNKESLSKAIEECENTGYLELSPYLKNARDTLESLGGGRGGFKTPEILRQKLQRARNQDDKQHLEKVLNECIAAGMPELDNDIELARNDLSYIGYVVRGAKTPETLRDEIKSAVRLKDKNALRRLIDESEKCAYPEVAGDLRRARDTLQSLGGGRGGSLTPDDLRKILQNAVAQKDKPVIQRAISKCIAVGMPELDNDILQARKTLDILKGTSGDFKPPDVLRDKLKMAMRQKNIPALQKAIHECEAAEYPEIGTDLRKARETLESLGGGRGGSKSPDLLREKLKLAMRKNDQDLIMDSINECIASGFPELDADVQKARDTVGYYQETEDHKSPEKLRDELNAAMRQKDRSSLERSISECEEAGYPEISSDLSEARNALESLGGGRGGLKNPDSLRGKLKMAVRWKDRPHLESVINECVASGFPELETEVHEARDVLDLLEGGVGGKMSPKALRDKLKQAVNWKDRLHLEKAIDECEGAGYPELGSDLRRARTTLQSIGGGLGGHKTPEGLREKLQSAMLQKNRPTLERIINECVASGFPELDSDISRARDILKKLGGGRRAYMTPDALRSRLKMAIDEKDQGKLEAVIIDCEEAVYPELGLELRKARDTLTSLGGGRGGVKNAEVIADKMKRAIRRKDRLSLERIINEAIAAGLPELDSEIENAQQILGNLDNTTKDSKSPDALRAWLKDASRQKDVQELVKAINKSEKAKFPEISFTLRKARRVLQSLGGHSEDAKTTENLLEKLRNAIKEKDVVKLEKTINDCVSAGIPELDSDIQEARDFLIILQGGAGGFKSPHILREEMKQARQKQDKEALEIVIKECEAAGYPELSFDLQKTKYTLRSVTGGREVLASAEVLKEEIESAVAQKSRSRLERLIEECESVGYPELSNHLRRARDTLENLGGGRGGSKSASELLEKLKSAIEGKNVLALDKVLCESVSAGMPELDFEIQHARNILNILDGGSGDLKSVDDLRTELDNAIKDMDIPQLEKVIKECEDAGFPEIGYDLCRARNTLKSLGGGYGGSKTVETLSQRLAVAVKECNPEKIQKAINECLASGFPELEADVKKARKFLRSPQFYDAETLRTKLVTAMKQKEHGELAKAIRECEKAEYPELNRDLRKARDLLKSLGGGLGGTKTPDCLIEKLKSARAKKDRDLIKKTINECVSAGMSELDNEIQLSRETLDIMEGGTGATKAPDVLVSQLKSATRQKDKTALAKIIIECEEAGYPEIANDLWKARETLHSICGEYGGSQTPQLLAAKLKRATRTKDKYALEKAINECVASGFPELKLEIAKARNFLFNLEDDGRGRNHRDILRDMLLMSMKRKSPPELKKAIEECEEAEYPELNEELRKARDLLENLSGSSGGTKTPRTLLNRLIKAMEMRDKDALEKIINECVASGFPQLDADIQQARNILDVLEFGSGETIPSQTLRSQLETAMEENDKDKLEKVIQDCENVLYPELSLPLSDARDMLEIMTGSRGGSKTPEALLDKLKKAVWRKDRKKIEKRINECVAAGFPELDHEIQKARELLEELGESYEGTKLSNALRDKLKSAMRRKDKAALENAIMECEVAAYPELSFYLRRAREVLESLSGSTGGIKTFPILLDKLKRAIMRKDRAILERVINECVAAGMPELDPCIQEARELLSTLKGASGAIKSSGVLREQLITATKEKNRGKLLAAIEECEDAEFLELSAYLRKARETLEMMGGGAGGYKTADTLREKIENAIALKDRSILEQVINECISSGFSGLDADIQTARDLLHTLEFQDEDIEEDVKSPESLRYELETAMEQKDMGSLLQAITESEISGYPELSSTLRQARDVLESIGGGRGMKSPEILREKLKDTLSKGDKSTIENVIVECVAHGMPELDSDIHKAREKLEKIRDISRGPSLPTPDALREELKKATRQKDKRALENIIDVCETTGYPELGPDLCRARNTLQQIGGGRGGSLSPDIIKRKLKDAMNEKDKRNLDRIINECTAAGLPELENDLQKARRLSNILGGGTGDVKSPNELHDQLNMAIRKKDVDTLNKAIMECEAAGYPELDADIRKARVALKNLGGSRGGSKSPEALRQMLSNVMQHGDKAQLESAVNECVAAGLQELDTDVQKARELLHDLREKHQPGSRSPVSLRNELKKATKERNRPLLEKLIRECEEAKYPELSSDLRQARDTLKSLSGECGGTISADMLRDKLEDAMKTKDKSELDRVIQESVAAGMPGLDVDIQQARRVSDILGGGSGDVVPSDTLQSQLARAIRQKDIGELQKAIADSEEAGYPELAADLCKARDTLESLGGGRGGNKTPDSLRTNLRNAMREGDKGKLDRVINECVTAGLPELDSDIERARNVLEDMRQNSTGSTTPDSLRNQLKRAVTQKNKANLEKAIHDAEAAGYPELAYDLRKARETLEKLGGGRGGIKTPESVREALKYAMKEADEPALERAIKDATAAGFPELASDVQKARDKLDLLRGGRGATKSAESLKKMLHDAVAMKNKSALEQAIKECEAAAYPELSYDLREARDALENIGGGRGGSKSPDILRNKLKSAIRQKDPNAIEKAISECVAAGHPELTGDIQQARDTLNSIGGVHKAPKSPSVLRDQLDHAVKQKDIIGLERAIAEAEAAKSPELSSNIKQARDLLDSLDGGSRSRSLSPEQVGTLLDQINTSIIHKDKPKLEKAIADAEPYRHPDLEPQIQKARPLLDALNIKDKLESAFLTDNQDDIRRCVIEIEQKNLTDYLSIEVNEARSRIRGYAAPDPSAFLNRDDVSIDSRTSSRMGWYMRSAGFSHDLLISALVVLGEYERHSESQAWRNYQHFFDISNSDGSSRRVLGFDIDQIYQNLSARADEILTRNSTDEVQLLNRSGQMSYSWSRSLNEQMRAYFHNLNGTMGGGESSFGETHSMSQMSGTSRTDYQTFTTSRESSQGSDNTNAHRPATERHSTTTTVRSVNRSGPTTFFQRKY